MTRPTPRRAPSPAPSQARNFTLLWVWLGFLVFWMGVAGLNHFDPPVRIDPDQPSAPKVAPLAGFFTDDSHVLAADQGRRFVASARERERIAAQRVFHARSPVE